MFEVYKGLIFWLISGLRALIFGLIFGRVSVLLSLQLSLLIFWLTFGVFKDEIKTLEIINVSIKIKSLRLIFGLILGVSYGLLLGVSSGLIFGLILGVSYGLFLGVSYGIQGKTIVNKTIPNQGIYQSVINTVVISGAIFSLSQLFIFFMKQLILPGFNLKEALIVSLPSGLILGLFIAIPRSGTPAIQHFVLRVILWANGYAPWNYAKFLDYCTNRLFLQRVGGGYRFMHDLLRQHFANYSVPRNLAPIQETTVATSVLIPDYISCTNCGHHNSTNCKFCTQCGMGLNQPDI